MANALMIHTSANALAIWSHTSAKGPIPQPIVRLTKKEEEEEEEERKGIPNGLH